VGRWFSTLTAWEDTREGALVTEQRIEKGVCYKDGVFTDTLRIDGSTTDATHYLWLTVAPNDRHTGIEGTGVILNPAAGQTGNAITVSDPYTVLEWLEITDWGGDGRVKAGISCSGSDAANSTISYCIIHDVANTNGGGSGIGCTGANSKIYRNIIYETGTPTLNSGMGYISGWANISVIGNTIYNVNTGIYRDNDGTYGTFYNNIIMNCATANFGANMSSRLRAQTT